MTLENIMEKEILPIDDMDKQIPTRIAELDTHIQFLRENAARLQAQTRLYPKQT